jgi:protein arginine N-methyltransferase 2
MATTTPAAQQIDDPSSGLPKNTTTTENVRRMIDACGRGDLAVIRALVQENAAHVCQQDDETGISPLMAASKAGHLELVQQLLEQGAPWNAVDRQAQCAGNYATTAEHWGVVHVLVEWGTRAELILGELQRSQWNSAKPEKPSIFDNNNNTATIPAEHEPCTKPDYLKHRLRYNPDGTALLDQDDDAVMMEWERPIMKAHAQILMEEVSGGNGNGGKRVMNVGFGMGIIDSILQDDHSPNLHIIIEAHPDVYQKMLKDKWDQKPNVQICHGKWQDVLPTLIQQGVELDAVFYDTYGEHALDMEDFHGLMSQILSKPKGVYSFFNGLAPDNLFFHGVGTFYFVLSYSIITLLCQKTNWNGMD